ncbi:hypothetical protein D3C85_712010 [compost metagenome]
MSKCADFGRIEAEDVLHGYSSFCWGAATFVTKRMEADCMQVGQPGQKEPGRRERFPHTAAISRNDRHKKSACVLMGRLCAFCVIE